MSKQEMSKQDTPSLTPSTAAREATPVQSQIPHGAVLANIRPGVHRGQSSDAVSKDTNDIPSDYFEPRGRLERRASGSDLRLGMASPMMPALDYDLNTKPKTEIRAGVVQKSFMIETETLKTKSPYFAKNLAQTPQPTSFSFPDLDEYAVALFVRWAYGGQLQGPDDFHSMNHYLCLYILANQFEIEELKNSVMDLVRGYYRRESMTAPAFRLHYVYSYTDGPNLMRRFLTETAAFRCVSEREKGISESVKGVIRAGGDFAVDFAVAVLGFADDDHGREKGDVRRGDPCVWHDHFVTPKCPPYLAEPFEGS